ncbi:MAG: alpha/beta hydrolase [Marinilabiliales bacterium]|nr:alpha/beta hydrolase [Marinilabiliales bacterium]
MKKPFIVLLFLMWLLPALAQTPPNAIANQEEIIYGRKNGMALTMNVVTSKVPSNHRGIILAISAGLQSNFDTAKEWSMTIAQPYLMKGYTVFAVCHGSAPKYTIPEILEDMHRAVRYIRFNAGKFGIDPDKIGMSGASSGGYLSLMMGSTGMEADPNAKDPIDRVPGNIQAVACFFPPTDFLNFGQKGTVSLGTGQLADFKAAFDFKTWNKSLKCFETVTDQAKLLEIGREISPIYHLSAHSAPAYIAHGDADELIPLQQSESIISRMKELNVPCELVIKKGGMHKVWPDMVNYLIAFSNWFDEKLK